MNTCCEQENLAIRNQVAELRSRDSLTGLYNRSQFYRYAMAAVKKPREGVVQALLYIRPDHFSGLDERLGPLGSDALLKSLGELVKQLAGRNAVVSRFGGNVFCVLVARRSTFEVRQMAEQMLEKIDGNTFSAGDLSTKLTVSIGLVELTASVKDTSKAFVLAQQSARTAREKGGNALEICNSAEEDAVTRDEDRKWVRYILSALVEDRFQLAFQPIAGLMGSSSNINDVLVRMLDTKGNEIMPGEFMPAAESAGLMPDIDKWVITQTLNVAEERQQSESSLIFIVRVSEPSLIDAGFESWLTSELGKHFLTQATIVFQVTESIAERHTPLVKSLAACCEKMNCGFAIGHFGLSAGCIRLLEELPLDYLMIHGSFMEDLEDPQRRDRLDDIVIAAKELEIPTVATRVEDARALSTLCQIGIDYIQGYHLQDSEDDIQEEAYASF